MIKLFFVASLALYLLISSPVQASDAVCLNCHVEESLRSKKPCSRWQKNSHPINIVPSPLVTIPEQYPLNEKGEIDCNTCHDVFGKSAASKDKTPAEFSGKFLLRGKSHNSIMCKQCHVPKIAIALEQGDEKDRYGMIQDETFIPDKVGSYMEGKKTLYNHPVDIQMPRLPRKIIDVGGQEGVLKDQIICETCHTAHSASGKPLLVMDNSESKLCGECHAHKYGHDRETTALKGTHPVNIVPSTAEMSNIITLKGGKQGRNKKMICLTCHSIHSAVTEKGLLVDKNVNDSFCYSSCHQNIEDKIRKTRHDFSSVALQGENGGGKTEKGGLCSPCHMVHGGKGIKMWARTIENPDPEDPVKSLCLSCHEKGKLAAAKQIGTHTHPTGVLSTLTDNPYIRLPLFSKAGVRIGQGMVTCASCHNVHRWDPDSDDRGNNPEEEGNTQNSFLRKRNIRSSLCFECHVSPRLIEGTSHDLNSAIYDKSLAPQLVFKGIEEKKGSMGICDHCHRVHNAVSVMLWARQIGTGDDYISRICFSCHSDSMVAEKKQIGQNTHPVNISINTLSDEISPDLPLFSDNLDKEFQGKIFCNTCHDSHRWDPNTEEKDGVTNASNSYLRISAASSQKNLCMECHTKQGIVTETSHDLLKKGSELKNVRGWMPYQSGVCGVCHATHNAATQVMLWNLPFGEGEDLFSKACNSCHGESRQASKIGISHPVNINAFSVLDDLNATTMPIFDDEYRPIKIEEMDPTLSPVKVQSLLTLDKEDKPYRDDPDMVRKFNYLKRMYNDIKREKNIIKEKLISFIEQKSILRDSLEQSKEKFKKINSEVGPKSEKFRRLKRSFRKLEQRVGVSEEHLRTIQIELGIQPSQNKNNSLKNNQDIPDKSLNSPSSVSSPKKRKIPRNKRLVKAEKEYEEAVRYLQIAQKEYAELEKNLGKNMSLRDKLKTKVEKLTKDYDVMNRKQGQENKKYKLLKTKMNDIRQQLKEINPRSFIEVERDIEQKLRIGDELLNESEMDYKIKYLTLLSKMDGIKDQKGTVSNKYRSMRNRYMDLLLNPKLRKNISKMELDTVLDEELLDEIIGDLEHEPVGKMFCPTCHNVHAMKNKDGNYIKSFLRISNDRDYKLCINCHQEKEWIVGTDHDLSVTAPDEENVLGRTIEESGVCSACHLVHNAVESFNLWAKKIDREKVDQLTSARKRKKELKKLIRLRVAEFKQVKSDIEKTRSNKNPSAQILKKSKAKLAQLKKKLKNLNNQKRLTKKQKNLVKKKYKQQIVFLKKYINKTSKAIQKDSKNAGRIKTDYTNLKKIMKDAQTEYELLQEKIDRMEVELTRSNWDALSLLCNSCHAEDLCADDKVIGYNSHPMNVRGRHFLQEVVESEQTATELDFELERKDTAMDKLQKILAYPLYTQEGKRDFESGRMFCPTCHNVHQWDPQKSSPGSGIPEEGDIYNSFLRDRSFPEPTMCINCHPQKVLVIGTDHDMSVSAPYAKNFQGKTAASGGVCSPCHVVHNSLDRYRLWARHLGPSYLPSWSKRYRVRNYKPIQLCTSCHQKGQWAEEKVPVEGLHYYNPIYYLKEVSQVLVRPRFPYFDYSFADKTVKMGVREILHGANPLYPVHNVDGEISDRGNISCFTCHDAHQWNPNKKKEGPGRIVEGDVTNSFLKKDTAKNFCSDCHKIEALYNYTFYHFSRTRLSINREITPENPHWKKPMEESSCTSCHQNDPKSMIHPVGVVMDKESNQYKYPEKIPLNNGEVICISCHNPKIQTEKFAMVRDKNRFFLRGLYDSLTVAAAASEDTEKVMVGGPPTAMLQLKAGPKNLGAFAKAREKAEDTTTSWIKMSKFIQYQVCYNCHKKEDYQQFSPHRHQMVNGKINPEMCFLCHSEIPDRKKVQQNKEGFKLRAEIEFYCIDCHQDKNKKHPGGADHFGNIMTKKFRKQFKEATSRISPNSYLPLKGGKLVCPSCHNIHVDGVILDPSLRAGRPEKKWLRLEGKDNCISCHKRTSEYTPKRSESPF